MSSISKDLKLNKSSRKNNLIRKDTAKAYGTVSFFLIYLHLCAVAIELISSEFANADINLVKVSVSFQLELRTKLAIGIEYFMWDLCVHNCNPSVQNQSQVAFLTS